MRKLFVKLTKKSKSLSYFNSSITPRRRIILVKRFLIFLIFWEKTLIRIWVINIEKNIQPEEKNKQSAEFCGFYSKFNEIVTKENFETMFLYW